MYAILIEPGYLNQHSNEAMGLMTGFRFLLRATDLSLSIQSIPAVGPIPPLIWGLYPGIKWRWCESYHSPLSSVEVGNGEAMPPHLQKPLLHST
jgi:hypothetical protein